MTKKQYLNELKNNLQALTLDEQEEALQYYSDYFDEEGFDQELVFEKFGSPEELGKSISEKLANALIKKEDEESEEENKSEKNETSNRRFTPLYFEFAKSDVRSINFSFGASEVIVISGDKFSFETRGILAKDFVCSLDEKGLLTVKNKTSLERLKFFSHQESSKIISQILVTIPEGTDLDNMKLVLGAGRFETHKLDLSCKKGSIETVAGNFVLNGLNGTNVNIRCGMGNISISGKMKGRSNIDCGMGAIKLDLLGNINDYSYDARVGLGNVKVNNEQKSGAGQQFSSVVKENHFSIACGMGSVNIVIS